MTALSNADIIRKWPLVRIGPFPIVTSRLMQPKSPDALHLIIATLAFEG